MRSAVLRADKIDNLKKGHYTYSCSSEDDRSQEAFGRIRWQAETPAVLSGFFQHAVFV
jgi:hypothetical protein